MMPSTSRSWAFYELEDFGRGLVFCQDRRVSRILLPRDERSLRAFVEAAGDAEEGGFAAEAAGRLVQFVLTGCPEFAPPFVGPGLGPFLDRVLGECSRIPRGRVASYSELAHRAGSPRAVRAVGQAMARNPLPLLIPCHRVVPSTGGVGQYGGGAPMKAWLLDLEGAPEAASA